MDAPTFQLEKPSTDYTQVCNAVLRDRSISYRAKGLYALMFSKPNHWVFHEKALAAESIEGRDAIRAAMKELIAARWIEKRQPRDGGKFGGVVFRLHITADWKTGDGSTGDGESAYSNTEYSKTDKPTPQPPKGEPDGFDEVWKAKWSRGTGTQPRQPAMRAYVAALKGGAKPADILAAVKARVGVDKPDTVYAPMLSTWLNQGRWKDGNGSPVLSAEDIAKSLKRTEDAAAAHKAHMDSLALQRSNQLLRRAS